MNTSVFVVFACNWSQLWSDTHSAIAAFENSRSVQRTKDSVKGKREKRGRSGRAASDLLSKPCICNTCVILHLLTKRCLQDDYQSADTNPSDFKLPFSMIRKRVWNLNYKKFWSLCVCVWVCVQPTSVKLRWMLNGEFKSTVTTPSLI